MVGSNLCQVNALIHSKQYSAQYKAGHCHTLPEGLRDQHPICCSLCVAEWASKVTAALICISIVHRHRKTVLGRPAFNAGNGAICHAGGTQVTKHCTGYFLQCAEAAGTRQAWYQVYQLRHLQLHPRAHSQISAGALSGAAQKGDGWLQHSLAPSHRQLKSLLASGLSLSLRAARMRPCPKQQAYLRTAWHSLSAQAQ